MAGDDLGDAVAQEEPGGAAAAVDTGQVEVGVAEAAGADAEGVGEAQIAACLRTPAEHGHGRNNKIALVIRPATCRYGARYSCCPRP